MFASPQLPNLHVPAAVSQRNTLAVLQDSDRPNAQVGGEGAQLSLSTPSPFAPGTRAAGWRSVVEPG